MTNFERSLCALIMPLFGACTSSLGATYIEAHDSTNNWNVGGTPEPTGLTLGATGSIVIDAQVNSGHHDSEHGDNDTFTIAVSTASTATVTLTGDAANSALSLFEVEVLFDVDGHDRGEWGHALVDDPRTGPLGPGMYMLEVHAQSPMPITTTYPYSIEIAAGG